MSGEMITTLIVLGAAVALFLSGRVRVDLVAILVLLALAIGGLISPVEAVAGFSNPAVVTVCSVFILSAGLYRSGIANFIGRQILRFAGQGDIRMLALIMMTAGVMSFFMNTMGIVALMLPVVMEIARRTGRAPSKLLMPLSFGALLGGLTTLFATLPNLLVSNFLKDHGYEPFGIFDFVPVGLTAALAGMGFMLLGGKRLLPRRDLERESSAQVRVNLQEHYQLQERLFLLRIPLGSPLISRALAESRVGSALGVSVIAIVRHGRAHFAPEPSIRLQAHDKLLVEGTPEKIDALAGWKRLTPRDLDADLAEWFEKEFSFAEFTVEKDSVLDGQSLAEMEFRRRYGLNVLAIRRSEAVRRANLQSWKLHPGDVLLVSGANDRIAALESDAGITGFKLVNAVETLERYQLQERLFVIEPPEGSRLIGNTLEKSKMGEALGSNVIGIAREGKIISMPRRDEMIAAGDRLILAGRSDDLVILQGLAGMEVEREVASELKGFDTQVFGLMEAVVSPRAGIVGRTLRELNFREVYGCSVLGVLRAGEVLSANLRDLKLQFGDGLLLFGPRDKLRLINRQMDFVVLSEAMQPRPDLSKAPFAILALLAFLVPLITGWLPLHLAALLGAAVMVVSRCLTMEEAYGAVEWNAVILIAGMLPLSTALQGTGAATFLADHMIGWFGGMGPMSVVAAIFLITAVGACVMPSAALVLLMAPIALRAAEDLGISPHAMMMALAMAAAGSFNSPIAHPANIMIMGPGGYRFTDFLKVGTPLTLVVLIVVLIVLPVFWPLFPD